MYFIKSIFAFQANFYVFAPAVGNHLIVKVQKVGAKWASAQGKLYINDH